MQRKVMRCNVNLIRQDPLRNANDVISTSNLGDMPLNQNYNDKQEFYQHKFPKFLNALQQQRNG